MVTVSVVVPTRNRSRDLERCLRAIDQQTFRDFEIVIVDDGSDAAQFEQIKSIVENIESKACLLQRDSLSAAGSGPATSRNLGVSHSRGSLIAFCDDDDIWIDNKHLQEGVQFLNTNLEVNYFFADQIGITVDGKIVRSPWLDEACTWWRDNRVQDEAACIIPVDEIIAIDRFPHLNTTIVRKRTFDELGGFDRNLRYSSDLCFSYEIYAREKAVGYRNVVVANHYVPDPDRMDNVSTQLDQSEKDLIYATIANKIIEKNGNEKLSFVCRQLSGFAYKRLSEEGARKGNWDAAVHFARLALGTKPTVKWLVYTQYLRLRYILRGLQ